VADRPFTWAARPLAVPIPPVEETSPLPTTPGVVSGHQLSADSAAVSKSLTQDENEAPRANGLKPPFDGAFVSRVNPTAVIICTLLSLG